MSAGQRLGRVWMAGILVMGAVGTASWVRADDRHHGRPQGRGENGPSGHGRDHAPGPPVEPVIVDARMTVRDLDDVLEKLDALDRELRQTGRHRDRMRSARKMQDIRAAVQRVRDGVSRAPRLPPREHRGPPPMQPPPAVDVPPQPMGPAAFDQMVAAINQVAFSHQRLEMLRESARFNHYTCAQVVAVLQLFPHSNDKVEAAVVMYPQVVDPQNFVTVYPALPYSSSQDELRRRIRR